ncbi:MULTISPECIES: DUF4236 domain-containing protein [Bacillus cereus group]|uniref:DUF4236 domain-containing protein n=1 Tax=Bacillus paranthracis TaxID=2026186 RepID=A0A7D8D0L6_9BACI|nr:MULTISPECIES: DUF4236 domain-containing protein [Bacillus cereus group]MDX5900551.1 DUF4236 domain-containing protein [Bacillus cereus group sp. BfR-BA-00707]SMD58966.1 hypothetical protein BACERE00174_00061 [Bacillus paranthracis]HDR7884610.1 DUF4236 domain-containing protein [Bacillus paranthracis]HDT6613671.1 DUF4236 domain-containing protein [Bacillus paranthracis]HDT6618379.1 DUF4236 domain-containing protein [Bacillus paranthracis]
MGFRFRKSKKIAPGIRLNASKKGIGISIGVKGARVSFGPSGTRVTTSIPGTGISYQKQISNKSRNIEELNYQNPTYTPQTVEVDAITIRDSQATINTRKIAKPLYLIMIIAFIASISFVKILFAIIFGVVGFISYRLSLTPVGVICPTCNRQHLAFKQKEIKCSFCNSTLIIKRHS